MIKLCLTIFMHSFAEAKRAFRVVTQLFQIKWNNKLSNKGSIEFKSLASTIENEVFN